MSIELKKANEYEKTEQEKNSGRRKTGISCSCSSGMDQ